MNFKYLKVIKFPTKELLEILNNNVIGTPGQSMLYQHLGVDNKIHRITEPYFVNLVRNNKIVGTCCFCSRNTINEDKSLRSFYIRYFSFKDEFRRRRITEKSSLRHSVLREEIKAMLSGQALGIGANEKFYHYAYVDPRNIRSLLLCDEFGFEPVRQYTTIIFNRINPREDKNIKIVEVSPGQENVIKKLLADFYKNFTMFSFENILGVRKYYVIKDQSDRIVAGAQVNPDRWKILSLPGLTGKVILNTFTHLPYLNRLFNNDYRFLTLEGIYFAPGYESYLEVLFESLLTKYHLNSAIIVVDAETQLYRTIKSLKLGLVDKLNKEVRGNVICKFVNFEDDEKSQFRINPAYISGIDVT